MGKIVEAIYKLSNLYNGLTNGEYLMVEQCDWEGLAQLRFSKNRRKRELGNRAHEYVCAKWADTQKALYHSGKLSQEHIDALNATEGWTWVREE